MDKFDELINAVEVTGEILEFAGPQSEKSIRLLEETLGVKLSPSYVVFLKRFGGGGTINGISGIYDENPLSLSYGSVYGDTIRTRKDFNLPECYIVIYRDETDAVWCLDLTQARDDGEYPVVAYDVFTSQVATTLTSTFESLFIEYLEIRAEK